MYIYFAVGADIYVCSYCGEYPISLSVDSVGTLDLFSVILPTIIYIFMTKNSKLSFVPDHSIVDKNEI